MFRFTFLTGGLIFLLGCTGSSSDVINESYAFDFTKLIGKWCDVDQKSQRYERWILADEGLLQGTGYVLYEKDTVFIERMFIDFRKDEPTFSVGLAGAKNNNNVLFELKSVTNDQVTFENPTPDNLKTISYKMISHMDMRIFIDEMENGAFGEKRFSFIRIK